MSDTVIKVENLGKKYILSHLADKREQLFSSLLVNKAKSLFRGGKQMLSAPLSLHSPSNSRTEEEFWALNDVSFEIKQGDRVGIIGRNGAGKSTLLKILSRITEPTKGRITINGRIASLLEVGTGFHSELSGRENIYLNGAILGMSREEIKRKFDEIVDFAEVEKFLDTPVKRYSSGMYVRLAFAVAAHLEPEILIVDEVLAVGDAEFQKKCLGKMEDVSTKQGRTVLFVSHNMGAISRLCTSAVLLDAGSVKSMGTIHNVLQNYQTHCITSSCNWIRPENMSNNLMFKFISIGVNNSQNSSLLSFAADEEVLIEIVYEIERKLTGCQVGVRVTDSDGNIVFTTADTDTTNNSAFQREPGKYRALFIIPGFLLTPGTYTLTVVAHLPHRTVYEIIEQAVSFTVTNTGWVGVFDGRLGAVSPRIIWKTSICE